MTKPNHPSREIKHIWADHSERHMEDFAHWNDFNSYRSHIGGLLLLSKSFNAGYSDLPCAEKRGRYLGQNLLARSLHEKAYDHNSGLRFIEESCLPFRPHRDLRKREFDMRRQLYRRMAERTWDPDRLAKEAS